VAGDHEFFVVVVVMVGSCGLLVDGVCGAGALQWRRLRWWGGVGGFGHFL
jgi:hypothetical protein